MEQYIAIDIGGTFIKSCIVKKNGMIESKHRTPTPKSVPPHELLDVLAKVIKNLYSEDIAGIGISTLGVVDREKGMVVGACENLSELNGLPLKTYFNEMFSKPISIINDVNAATLGEASFGSGKNLDQFYCLTFGTGIGGAFYYNGSIVSGKNNRAGEIGYIGQDGHEFEKVASVKSFYDSCIAMGLTKDVSDKLFQDALDGYEPYQDLFEKWMENIAEGMKNIVYLLDPGVIIVGGGISEYGEKLTKKIEDSLNKRLNPSFVGKTKILPAKTGNTANMLGAISEFL